MTETELLSGLTTQTYRSSLVMAMGVELVVAPSFSCLARSGDISKSGRVTHRPARQQRVSVTGRMMQRVVEYMSFLSVQIIKLKLEPAVPEQEQYTASFSVKVQIEIRRQRTSGQSTVRLTPMPTARAPRTA